jgi:hypothetical protein
MNRQALGIALTILAAAQATAQATQAAAPAAAPSPAARGGQGWFLGAGIGAVDYSEPGGISASSVDYLYLQGGWRFNRHLALDARVATNLPGGCGCDYYYFSNPLDIRVRSLYGLYLRGTAPLTPHWDLYGLAGYASLSLEANVDPAFARTSARSASYGLGTSWVAANGFALDLELLPRLVQGDGWRTDALNLGFHYQF